MLECELLEAHVTESRQDVNAREEFIALIGSRGGRLGGRCAQASDA
jgi:hypothetical protein